MLEEGNDELEGASMEAGTDDGQEIEEDGSGTGEDELEVEFDPPGEELPPPVELVIADPEQLTTFICSSSLPATKK